MILISSGHGLSVRGAQDIIDEVDEARRVVNRVGEILSNAKIPNEIFHENSALNATDNVNTIVSWHNSKKRELDVSVHFNAVAGTRDTGIGVETLYFEQSQPCKDIASNVSHAISKASGLILRRFDGTLPSRYAFLRLIKTSSILIEVCFVNSRTDVRLYRDKFDEICHAIAEAIGERKIEVQNQQNETVKFNIHGKAIEIPGLILGDRTFSQARPLLEACGLTVEWDENTRTVIVTGGNAATVKRDTIDDILQEMDAVLTKRLLDNIAG